MRKLTYELERIGIVKAFVVDSSLSQYVRWQEKIDVRCIKVKNIWVTVQQRKSFSVELKYIFL
jgi:hypothetical protein